MDTEDVLYWMLAEAKKRPMKISHDFDTRYRVWVEQIIPARLNAIRQCEGDMDYAVRMVRLTLTDADRLRGRALYEFSEDDDVSVYAMRTEEVSTALVKANDDYLNEVKQ